MSGYSDTGLYIPATEDEITQIQFNLYNIFLDSFGIPQITYEQYKTCNINILLQTAKEYDLQTENAMGLLYTKIVNYIISLTTSLQIKPYGCTTVGIYNALMGLEGVNAVSIDEPNRQGTTLDPAYMELAIDGTPDSNALFDTLLNNIGGGVVTTGDQSVSGVDPSGQGRTYKYTGFTASTLKVKLFFVYNDNYYGNRLQVQQIIDNYIAHWHDVYRAGNDLLPAEFNELTFYPSLGYLDSQFSVDGGTTWLTRNEIYDSDFNEIFTLDENITAEQE